MGPKGCGHDVPADRAERTQQTSRNHAGFVVLLLAGELFLAQVVGGVSRYLTRVGRCSWHSVAAMGPRPGSLCLPPHAATTGQGAVMTSDAVAEVRTSTVGPPTCYTTPSLRSYEVDTADSRSEEVRRLLGDSVYLVPTEGGAEWAVLPHPLRQPTLPEVRQVRVWSTPTGQARRKDRGSCSVAARSNAVVSVDRPGMQGRW